MRERRRKERRTRDERQRELQLQDEDEGSQATRATALVLHDSLKAGALEALLGSFRGFLICVGADLNVEVFVGLRSDDERRKLFLLQCGGDRMRVDFFAKRGN